LRFDAAPRRAYTWPTPGSCNAPAADYSRPQFGVTHGPGYQNTMVIPHSYGKNCSMLSPGAAVNKSDALLCPDRTDCENVNNDALLMSGYLCHPCLPNICDGDEVCTNIPYEGVTCALPSPLTTAEPSVVPSLTPTSEPQAAAVADKAAPEVVPMESAAPTVTACILVFLFLAG